MQIFVDADACPVVGIVENIAEKYNVPVTLLCDTNHVLYSDYSEVIVVGAGADAVDYKLISLCHKGDIVVSQDYGVAAMALGKGAYAIHQSGKWYTDENIDRMLMERHLNKKARRGTHKHHIKGTRKRTDEDDERFAQSFKKNGARGVTQRERDYSLINREDMLELTRRMTPSRTCFDRIAGAYISEDGDIDDSFNIHFGNLSGGEKTRNLAIAKTIPFAQTNEQLKEYVFPVSAKGQNSMWQLLRGILDCKLKNDALLYVFYELIADGYPVDNDFAIYLFHGVYDVPIKARDKSVLGESEEIYEFIIGTISPMKEAYEPAEPVFGFLYPAFSDRSGDTDKIDIFHANPDEEEEGLLYKFLGKAL